MGSTCSSATLDTKKGGSSATLDTEKGWLAAVSITQDEGKLAMFTLMLVNHRGGIISMLVQLEKLDTWHDRMLMMRACIETDSKEEFQAMSRYLAASRKVGYQDWFDLWRLTIQYDDTPTLAFVHLMVDADKHRAISILRYDIDETWVDLLKKSPVTFYQVLANHAGTPARYKAILVQVFHREPDRFVQSGGIDRLVEIKFVTNQDLDAYMVLAARMASPASFERVLRTCLVHVSGDPHDVTRLGALVQAVRTRPAEIVDVLESVWRGEDSGDDASSDDTQGVDVCGGSVFG